MPVDDLSSTASQTLAQAGSTAKDLVGALTTRANTVTRTATEVIKKLGGATTTTTTTGLSRTVGGLGSP